MDKDTIYRQDAIDAIYEDAEWCESQGSDWQTERKERDLQILVGLPSAPLYTPDEIQTMQDLEWSQMEKMYELGKEESNWISCKERLPERFQEVLVCGDNGDMDVIIGFTVDGIDDRWVWQMSPKLLFVKKIVAWQPLPEKFKEEGGEE